MENFRSIDAQVRTRLKAWPQCPPGLEDTGRNSWIRGRPDDAAGQCFLKLPGSERLRTLPDGLWLNFGGTPDEPYADIFGIMYQPPPRRRGILERSAPSSETCHCGLIRLSCQKPHLITISHDTSGFYGYSRPQTVARQSGWLPYCLIQECSQALGYCLTGMLP